jgi:sulfur-oxidizing protein SoxY
MMTRRDILTAGATLSALALAPGSGRAAAPAMDAAIAEALRGAQPERGRVHLGIPQIAENGFSVFTTVTVDSPMTAQDYVKAIHIFSEKNPIAHVVTFRLGTRAGRAKVSTNIRLAASQRVIAIAETSDGKFWSDEKSVVVTIAACIDGG